MCLAEQKAGSDVAHRQSALQLIDSSYNKNDLIILSAQTPSGSLQMDLFDEA